MSLWQILLSWRAVSSCAASASLLLPLCGLQLEIFGECLGLGNIGLVLSKPNCKVEKRTPYAHCLSVNSRPRHPKPFQFYPWRGLGLVKRFQGLLNQAIIARAVVEGCFVMRLFSLLPLWVAG
eukprot:jgi/Botrbrau1/10868/Bobra.0025s0045.1